MPSQWKNLQVRKKQEKKYRTLKSIIIWRPGKYANKYNLSLNFTHCGLLCDPFCNIWGPLIANDRSTFECQKYCSYAINNTVTKALCTWRVHDSWKHAHMIHMTIQGEMVRINGIKVSKKFLQDITTKTHYNHENATM